MTFKKDKIADFQRIFERSKEAISDFEGCLYLELCRDTSHDNVYFTYSHWDSEKALDTYRNSPFFKSTWNKTRTFFAAKAEVYSVERIYSSEHNTAI
jgi:heme-degrading monooxygenase HmoA